MYTCYVVHAPGENMTQKQTWSGPIPTRTQSTAMLIVAKKKRKFFSFPMKYELAICDEIALCPHKGPGWTCGAQIHGR